MAPQAAVRRSQTALDSDAAPRQQTQIDDIASSDPRLVEKIVVRSSWFVARKNLPLCLNRYGRISQAVRPLGVPYAQGRWPCIFLRPATSGLRISLLSFVSPLDAVDGGTTDAEFLGDFGAAFSFAAHFLDSFIGQIFQAAVFILH